jgi:hypothetical protein
LPRSERSILIVLLPVIIGSLVVFGATTLYTDYWMTPKIDLEHYVSGFRDSIHHLLFSNLGNKPADNLRITITPASDSDSDSDSNGISFTMGDHSQNTTLTQEGESWVMETRKFPVGAIIDLEFILKNGSESTMDFTVAADQGVQQGYIIVDSYFRVEYDPANPISQLVYTPDSFLRTPASLALAIAIGISIWYALYKLVGREKSIARDQFLREINDEVFGYYIGQGSGVDKKVHLKNLSDMRNNIRKAFTDGRIRKVDFEALENRILESIEKMNKNGNQ